MSKQSELLHMIHVKLYVNNLRDVEGKYIARSTRAEKTISTRDVCVSAKDRGGYTGNVEDLINHIEVYLKEYKHLLTDGWRISNGLFSVYPTIEHTFDSVNEKVGPGTEHEVSFGFLILSDLREAADNITVYIDGIYEADASIYEVYDVTSEAKNSTLTVGGMLVVKGKDIKVSGSEDEPTIGVYFDDENGDYTRIEGKALAENTAGELILQVPNLPTGVYHLRIETQWTHGSSLLKEARSVLFEPDLTVM